MVGEADNKNCSIRISDKINFKTRKHTSMTTGKISYQVILEISKDRKK